MLDPYQRITMKHNDEARPTTCRRCDHLAAQFMYWTVLDWSMSRKVMSCTHVKPCLLPAGSLLHLIQGA